jgi:hypothetical protein
MNDDFLTRFRKSPRREFSAALYERINTPMNTQRKFTFKHLTFVAAAVLALFAALLFSPSARAALQYLFRDIGGITYEQEVAPSTPVPESQVTIVPQETMLLAKAQEKLPYEIHLPAWVPDGFTMAPSVRISYFGERFTPVEITWYGDNGGAIILMIGQPVNWQVDLDHLKEVQVNGQPAGLTGGGWDADSGQWTGDQLTLTWKRGEVMYQLNGNGLSEDEMLHVAESIP